MKTQCEAKLVNSRPQKGVVVNRSATDSINNYNKASLCVNEAQSAHTPSPSEGLLIPWWVTGFVDGEGCFYVSMSKRAKLTVGVEVGLSFSISQKATDYKLLARVQSYFKCGGIRFSKRDGCYKYEVRNINDLGLVLSHFKQYPLQSRKSASLKKFSDVYKLVKSGSHLSLAGVNEIIETAYAMHPEGKRRQSKQQLLTTIGVRKNATPKTTIS